MSRPKRKRPPKGTPTDLNLRVMSEHFAGKHRAPNQICPTSTSHMRRCLNAGLFTIEGAELVLTEAGIAEMEGR